MTFLEIYVLVGLVVFGCMTILWMVSLWLKNASIVDIFWGTGFVIANWTSFALTPDGFLGRKIIISSLATIWGLRLSLHILRRNWGKPEDFRYRKWREDNGKNWWWKSFLQVFLLQGLLLWAISTPLVAAQVSHKPGYLTFLDWVAIPIWVIGFFFEAAGDWQLKSFKADPDNRGRILQRGVWRYTRHPNYFGDATQWWAYYLIAAAAGGFWTIFSPLLMTLLLVRVSGVALLEKTLKAERPEYREYIETTSAFIPWFPKKANKPKP